MLPDTTSLQAGVRRHPSRPLQTAPMIFSAPCRAGLKRLLCCAGDSHSLGLHSCYGNVRPSDEFCRLKHPINTSN